MVDWIIVLILHSLPPHMTAGLSAIYSRVCRVYVFAPLTLGFIYVAFSGQWNDVRYETSRGLTCAFMPCLLEFAIFPKKNWFRWLLFLKWWRHVKHICIWLSIKMWCPVDFRQTEVRQAKVSWIAGYPYSYEQKKYFWLKPWDFWGTVVL